MKLHIIAAMAIAIVAGVSPASAGEVTFTASDGVTVYGDLHETNKGAPLVILFHQAGANARAEYGNIIPRLVEHGYNVLAVDQRSGGDRLGGNNRTVDALKQEDPGYCAAYPDMEAALAYVGETKIGGPVFVWGSSYSAGLVLRLGVDHADAIAGVLAFSPASGGPMKACDPGEAIVAITVPVLALRPAGEMENESVRAQLEACRKHGHQTYVAKNGVHGSSMLNPDRVEGGVDDTWKVVFAFIDSTASKEE